MKKIFIAIAFFVSASIVCGQNIPKLKITDIEKNIKEDKDHVLVINFWATFCKPCVAEIPSFIELADKYKSNNVKLELVSVDLPSYYPKKIAAFAKKHKFNTNISWLDETNADYFCPRIDSSWSGSIPATLIVNTKTGYRKFFEGEIKAEKLEGAVKEALSHRY